MESKYQIPIKFLKTPTETRVIRICFCAILFLTVICSANAQDSSTFTPSGPQVVTPPGPPVLIVGPEGEGYQMDGYAKYGGDQFGHHLIYLGISDTAGEGFWNNSDVYIFQPDGELIGYIDFPSGPRPGVYAPHTLIYEMVFNNEGNLFVYFHKAYTSQEHTDTMMIFDRDGSLIREFYIPGHSGRVLDEQSNIYLKVGTFIFKYSYYGNLLTQYNLPSEIHGHFMDWEFPCILLIGRSRGGDSMAGDTLGRYNICTGSIGADFSPDFGSLPLKVIHRGPFAGNILIPWGINCNRLAIASNSGVVQIYQLPVCFTDFELDPDGLTFWVADYAGNVYGVNMVTGQIVSGFNVPGVIPGFEIINSLAVSGNIESQAATTKILNLISLIEGYYNVESDKLIEDTAFVSLRDASLPNSIIHHSKSELSNKGNGTFNFPNAVEGVPYYIVIKHRNSLETWSSEPVTFSDGVRVSYDFTSSSSQALGNNLVLKEKRWCIFSGDVNQDGAIDATDLGLIKNDANNLVTGYVPTDLNGDNIVDSKDISICENNAVNFVMAVTTPQKNKEKREVNTNFAKDKSSKKEIKKEEILPEKK